MTETILGPTTDLPDGEMRQYHVDGMAVLVTNLGGEYYAVEGICPHRGAQLAQGRLQGTAVVCPWHDWAFDVTTGQGITNPVSCLKRFKIHSDGEQLICGAQLT